MKQNSGAKWACTFGFCFLLFLGSSVNAYLVNFRDNPDLAKAMKFDLSDPEGDPSQANRKLAEKHYLAYLEVETESFQRAWVYAQLGNMYSGGVDARVATKWDLKKAKHYFDKVLEEEPDRIGLATISAHGFKAMSHENFSENYASLLDYYKWLISIKSEKLKNVILPSRPGQQKIAPEAIYSTMNFVKEMRYATERNIIHEAVKNRMPFENGRYSKEKALLNLAMLSERFPDTGLGDRAKKEIAKIDYVVADVRNKGDHALVVYSAQEIVDSVVDELDNVTDYSATVFNGINIPIIRDMLAGRLQWKRASGNWKGKMQEGMPYSKIHITDGVSWKCINNKGNVDYYSNAIYGSYIRSAYGTDMFNMENILSNETWAKDPSTVTINGVLCYRVYTTKENENYEVWIDEATRTKVIRVTATDEIDQLLWQLDYGDYSDVENTAWLPGKVVTKRYLEDMTVQFVSTYRFSNIDINSGLSDAIFAVDRVLPKGRPDKKTPFLTREMPDPNPAQLKMYLPYLERVVTPLCDLLRAESTKESVEMLHQIGEYQLFHTPGQICILPLHAENGNSDVSKVMSNRRFLKVLKELGSMPKSQAASIVNEEINKTLPLYLSMFDERIDKYREIGDVRLGGQMSNNPDKSPVFHGLRYKILALVFTAGHLGLDETQPAVLNVARAAITQRKHWYYSREFLRIDRAGILIHAGIYNRQILATGLFGTSGQLEQGLEDFLKTVDIECQTRKLTHFDSSKTPYDYLAGWGIPVDYSGGEQIVKFPEPIDDKSFDAILKAMEMRELLQIRYSKK